MRYLAVQNFPMDFGTKTTSLNGRNNNSKTGNFLKTGEVFELRLLIDISICFFFLRAENICLRYPEYRYAISGIGELPTDADEQLGKCSQMATFVRKDMLQLLNGHGAPDEVTPPTDESHTDEVVFPIEKFKYELLFSKEFPYDQDARSLEEKIIDDVKYFMNRHLYEEDQYFVDERGGIFYFPVKDIFRHVHEASDLDELRAIIRKEFVINDQDCVERELPKECESELSEYEEDVQDNDDVNTANRSKEHVTAAAADDDSDWE